MTTDQQLPLVLIGCGLWGQYILRDLKTLNCHVTVVCRSKESKERALCYGADELIDTVEQIKNPAGIVIATTTSTHLSVIESVLSHQVPLFVEKPLGMDIAKANSLLAKSGDRIFVMDKWRYHPGIEALAAIAKQKEFGEARGLQMTQLAWGSYHRDVDFIETILPHSLSMGYEIFGKLLAPASSYLVHERGKVVGLHALFGEEPWWEVNMAINSPVYRREIMLECERAIAVLGGAYQDTIDIYSKEQVVGKELCLTERRSISTEMPLLRELQGFVAYLQGGERPKSDGQFGIQVMESMKKVRQLASKNLPVATTFSSAE